MIKGNEMSEEHNRNTVITAAPPKDAQQFHRLVDRRLWAYVSLHLRQCERT